MALSDASGLSLVEGVIQLTSDDSSVTLTPSNGRGIVDLSVSGSVTGEFVRRDGTTPLTANWNAGAFNITASRFISTVANGTSPFVVTSATQVNNLNVQYVNGRSVGTSGATIPILNANNTISAAWAIQTNETPLLTLNQTSTSYSASAPSYIDWRGSVGTYFDNYPIMTWDDLTTFVPAFILRQRVNGAYVSSGNGQPLTSIIFEPDCFTGDTLVKTPTGRKRIDEVQVDDQLISINPETGMEFVNEVAQVLTHQRSSVYFIINKRVNVTPRHPFWCNGKWVEAKDLDIGDWVLSEDNEKIWIYSIEMVRVPTITVQTVAPGRRNVGTAERPEWEDYEEIISENKPDLVTYNLVMKMKGVPTYIANGFVVHNKCPYLYYFDPTREGKSAWVSQGSEKGTILVDLDSKEKEAIQRQPLTIFSNKYIIRELEPETSYFKNLWLIAQTLNGEVRLEWINRPDGEYIVIRQGGKLPIEFEEIPDGTTGLSIEAEGYYISTQGVI